MAPPDKGLPHWGDSPLSSEFKWLPPRRPPAQRPPRRSLPLLCFAVIAPSVGLNSLIKSNQSQCHFKKFVTPPTIVTIDVYDIFDVEVLATTASTLISVFVFNYISILVLPRFRALSTKTLHLQAYSLIFCCIVLLAAMFPFMTFRTREAVVRAFELPAAVVQKVAAESGSTPV